MSWCWWFLCGGNNGVVEATVVGRRLFLFGECGDDGGDGETPFVMTVLLWVVAVVTVLR